MAIRPALSTPGVHAGTLYFVALLREELGRRIKVAREGAGMTQRELALSVGLQNAQDISRYERGVQQVPDFRIDLIAEATGRTRSYFVRDPSEPEPREAAKTPFEEEIAVVMRNALNSQQEILRTLESLVAMHEATHVRLDRLDERLSGLEETRRPRRRTA